MASVYHVAIATAIHLWVYLQWALGWPAGGFTRGAGLRQPLGSFTRARNRRKFPGEQGD